LENDRENGLTIDIWILFVLMKTEQLWEESMLTNLKDTSQTSSNTTTQLQKSPRISIRCSLSKTNSNLQISTRNTKTSKNPSSILAWLSMNQDHMQLLQADTISSMMLYGVCLIRKRKYFHNIAINILQTNFMIFSWENYVLYYVFYWFVFEQLLKMDPFGFYSPKLLSENRPDESMPFYEDYPMNDSHWNLWEQFPTSKITIIDSFL